VTDPPIEIALYEPEIPGNAGNVARLCAATGAPLHLIGRLGFSFTHPKAKRAVMDYWNHLRWTHHLAYGDFRAEMEGRRVWCFTARAGAELWDAAFAPGDVLLYGPESRGLPDDVVAAAGTRAVRIPMIREARSLNLGNAVAVGLYEALRQTRGAREPASGGRAARAPEG
jgi:tRNA (cytidine/uridine-2'-O-)-methyltransferase